VIGDIIRTGVSRSTRRSGRQWSKVEHLARVSHTYGHSNEMKWVVPLCGAAAGRASFADTTKLCGRCALRQSSVEVKS